MATHYKIAFKNMPWEHAGIGVKQKVFQLKDQQIRLVRFEDNFIEKEWCTNGHVGFIVEGTMKIDFNGKIISYEKGDGLWIEKGAKHKHKAIIEEGKFVEIILFEF